VKDKRLDAYIAKAQPFARPILTKVRSLFHKADPDIQETFKWGMPTFEHGGIIGFMAAFKAHAAFGIWLVNKRFSKVTTLDGLPPDAEAIRLIRECVSRRAKGENLTRLRRARFASMKTPPDLSAALRRNKKALETFDSFSPGARRDYIEWIEEAKRKETRSQRLETTVLWLSKGRKRNWKYE
jgi:hypothetical protein